MCLVPVSIPMNKLVVISFLCVGCLIPICPNSLVAQQAYGDSYRCNNGYRNGMSYGTGLGKGEIMGIDYMDPRNFSLQDYQKLFRSGRTPSDSELHGAWRGVNKGIVTLFGYRQFIKEIKPSGTCSFGDNIQVHQVSNECLRCFGWQPKIDEKTGEYEREGKFVVRPENRIGIFGRDKILSYRRAGNSATDPAQLLVDKVVKIDENHLLGRVTGMTLIGPVPLAYFVLERVR